MEINKDELRRVYAQWTTEKLIHILKNERDQFEEVAISLIEEELGRRGQPIPTPTGSPTPPSPPPPPPPSPGTIGTVSSDPGVSGGNYNSSQWQGSSEPPSTADTGTMYNGPGFAPPPLPKVQPNPQPAPVPIPASPIKRRETVKATREIVDTKICMLCQGSFSLDENIEQCNNCHGYYHTRCWSDDRGCVRAGCREQQKQEETKRCPMCGETVKAVALKCKHCGEYFDKSMQQADQSYIGPKETLKEAKDALIMSIIGFFCCGIILGPIAISKGIKALDILKEDPTYKGKEMAIAGIIIGSVDILFFVVGMIINLATGFGRQY